MKKITLCLMLIFALIIVPGAIFAAVGEGDVAKIGDTGYTTLADAVKAVPTNKTEATTIELLKNVENGPGIVTEKGQNVIIDFNGYSYDASEPTVGSDGTETLGAQLNKGSTVVFKDGTFTTTKGKRVIQNYANLTLEDMVIDGTKSSNEIGYVVSFNNGEVNITGKTSIIATEGNFAFDNYFWPDMGYTDGAKVIINTTGTIKGNIELASSKKGLAKDLPSTLTIKNIKHDGIFNFVDERFKNAFTVEGGTYTDLGEVVAGVNKENKKVTITLLKTIEAGPGIVTEKGQNVIIDFNGYSYDASEPTVGSDGTETLGAQLNKGSTVVFKNGTFTTTKGKRVIQNYANLTLEDMVIDGTKSSNEIGYVISFNNGEVNITGKTSILAKEGNFAFDNYFWPDMGYTDGAKVTINTTGTIKGNIELASSKKGLAKDLPSTLTIKNIKHEGTFNVADERFKENVGIEKGIFTSEVSSYIVDGVVCKKINDLYYVGVEHKITTEKVEGGKIIVREVPTSEEVKEIEKAVCGETIEVVVEPAEGYRFKEILGVDGLKDVAEYAYQFTMPNKDVVLTPVFEKLTTEAEVPSNVANAEKVEAMVVETFEELVAKDPTLAEKIEGKNIEIEVQIKPVEINKEEKETIGKGAAKKVEGIKIGEYIDITISVKDADTDKQITTLSNVKEAIKFTVEIPKELKANVPAGYTRVFYIIRNHNGDIDVWETKETDGKLTFESDKFSTYAIAYKDVKNETTVTPPADDGKDEDTTIPPTGEGEIGQNPEVKPETDNKKEEIPESVETGDNVVIYAVFAVVAMAGMVITIKSRKK